MSIWTVVVLVTSVAWLFLIVIPLVRDSQEMRKREQWFFEAREQMLKDKQKAEEE